MTDETNTQPQGDSAPAATAVAEPPATPAPVDVESIVTARLAEWEEKRIKPLQTLLNEKNDEIKRLKTASMSEEDRVQLEIEEHERERQQFETERWLFQKAKENAKAAELIEQFLALEDPDEQFALVAQALSVAAPATPAPVQPEESEQVPDIDPNNPAPAPSDYGTLPDGTPINRKLAEDFFAKLGSWPTGR